MPKTAWTGYGRFCPLARALDVIGERWTLVIVQELMKRSTRYSDLVRRLPGISTTVLVDRLRKLEAAGVIERQPGAVGEGVVYAITERGLALDDTLEALRRWGVMYLTDPTADGGQSHEFDVRYVAGIDALDCAEFGLVVDGTFTTLRFASGRLDHVLGEPDHPELIVHTTSDFMDRWAAGTDTWDDGLRTSEVTLSGSAECWPRWLAATGYPLSYEPELSGAEGTVDQTAGAR
jgi:DNA-binding HxlR family transcriptional regulator